MNNTQVTFTQALGKSLPQMIQDHKGLNAIVEAIEQYILSDEFDEDSHIVKTLIGEGDFGEFDIDIHEFLGVFWISAPEFDDDGYFNSLDDAIVFAEYRYEPFITNYFSKEGD